MKKRIAVLTAMLLGLSGVLAVGLSPVNAAILGEAADEEFDWIPKSYAEYKTFREANGIVSLHGKYLVYCDAVNGSTGESVILEQTGSAQIQLTQKYEFSFRENGEFADGDPIYSIFVYEAITSGTMEVTISQGRVWSHDAPREVKSSGRYAVDEDLTITQIKSVPGDVNGDGMLNSADVVLFQKWILGDSAAVIVSCDAADLCKDGVLDAFDLSVMKQMLVQTAAPEKVLITMTDIIELSNRKYDWTMKDLEPYQCEDVGSGLYVYDYEIEYMQDRFRFRVGCIDGEILSARLETTGGTGIDIRDDDAALFFAAYNPPM